MIARGEPRRLLREQFEGAIVELPADDFRPGEGFPWPWYESNGAIEIQTGDVNATLGRLLADGVELQRLQVKSRTLEDLFLELTGRQLRS